MKKQDFTKWLRYKLYDLPTEELERILQYYSDAIADRMEDGMTEEEAVDALGTREDILTICRAGLPTQTAVKHSRKKVWALLGAAAALLALCVGILPKLFPAPACAPQVMPPETTKNEEIDRSGLHVQSGDDRVDIGWDGIHVQSGDDRVDIGWSRILAQLDEDRVDIGWGGILAEALAPASAGTSDPKNQMTLNFATDCLHALSIWEDVGNITVEPSSDDEIHVFFPDITQYDRMTTYDGILKIARVNNRPQSGDLLVQIPEGFDLSLDTNCGNIRLSGIAPGSLELQCDMGDISGSLAGRKSDYDIHTSVDVGSCNLPATQQTDGIPLTVRVDVGSIDLTFKEGNLT